MSFRQNVKNKSRVLWEASYGTQLFVHFERILNMQRQELLASAVCFGKNLQNFQEKVDYVEINIKSAVNGVILGMRELHCTVKVIAYIE